MSISQELALFSSRIELPRIPKGAQEKALHHFADWLANAAAGHVTSLGRVFQDLVPPDDVVNGAPLAGTLALAEPLLAALVNGGASHCIEYDDADRAGLFHPGAPVISAAWSAAAHQAVSGADFLAAIVAGYEVSQRLARAVNPGHYTMWHTTGTIGTFGAASAAARVLSLDPIQTAWSLGLAGTQAAGLWEVLPHSPLAKNLHPARAAQAGLLAARLAKGGIRGPLEILEGKKGVFAAMVPQKVEPQECLVDLGRRWLILEATLKAYPVCGHTMTPIEAALDLYGKFTSDDLISIEVFAHPVSIQVAGNAAPTTGEEAKFSIPYCVALALLNGNVKRKDFIAEAISEPLVIRLMNLITLKPNPDIRKDNGQRPARVVLGLKNGKNLTGKARFRKGDPENPLTDREIEDKFKDLTAPVWGPDVSSKIWDFIPDLIHIRDVRAWWRKLPKPTIHPWHLKGDKDETRRHRYSN
jgi:2-methylcitrate dehydratase PrpD